MENILLNGLLISLAINYLVFFIAYAKQNEKYTDVTYAATFIGVTSYYYWAIGITSAAGWINIVLVSLWGIRLGGFLGYRISKMKGKDSRFDSIRIEFNRLFKFFTIQAITVWVVNLVSYVIATNQANFKTWTIVFTAFSLVALTIETVADLQKMKFKQAGNKGLIMSGLYSVVRYPNYLGEIGFWKWLAIFAIFNINNFTFANVTMAIISPMFIALIIIKLSGIKMLEKIRDDKYGNEQWFIEYKENTNKLIPWFKKK